MGETAAVRSTGLVPSPLFLLLLAITVAGGALAGMQEGPVRTGGIVLLVLGGWAVSLCLHEFGHALLAYRGGDRSVRAKGYLTLDIRRYTDPVFSLVLPLLLLAVGGIPLPGVRCGSTPAHCAPVVSSPRSRWPVRSPTWRSVSRWWPRSRLMRCPPGSQQGCPTWHWCRCSHS